MFVKTTCRAVIDVGTNSVKLLVAEVLGQVVRPILETSEQTRLGQGFYTHHRLQPDRIAETAQAVARFYATAREHGVDNVRVIATSAARDAQNSHDLVAAIDQTSGLALEIISGAKEAELAFQGVASDPRFHNRPLLILEVGGGSTQVIFSTGQNHAMGHSYKIGSVRLMEHIPHSDPPLPSQLEQCRTHLNHFWAGQLLSEFWPLLSQQPPGGVMLVGTGGSSSVLASIQLGLTEFHREAIESVSFSLETMRTLTERLWSLPLAERRKIPGLPPKRADVMLCGAAIHEAAMTLLELQPLHVSTRGIRFAALLDEPQPATLPH